MRELILGGLILSVAVFAACAAKDRVEVDNFNLFESKTSGGVIMINSRTGETWRLEKDAWKPLGMEEGPDTFHGDEEESGDTHTAVTPAMAGDRRGI